MTLSGKLNKKTHLDGEIRRVSGTGAGMIVDSELSDSSTNPVQNRVVKAALDALAENAMSISVKNALLAIAQNVAYLNDDSDYYQDLYDALYPPAGLVSISAVFSQGQTVIYDTDSLDSLKQYLVVTALYDDQTTETLEDSAYTLSGTLVGGTSTITVIYYNKTTTFTVTVTHIVDNYIDEAVHVFTGQYMNVNPDYHFYQLADASSQNAYVIPIVAGTYRLMIKDTSGYNNVAMGSGQFNALGKQWFSISENDLSNATTSRTMDNTIEAPTFGEFTSLGLQEDGTYHRYVDVTYSKAGYIALSLVQNRGDWSLKKVV